MSINLQPSDALPRPYITTSLVDVTHKLPMKPPCRIMFKNELEQPSGSFKLRGIGHLIHKSIEQSRMTSSDKQIHVFALSGGNAGLAAAYLASFYDVKCTVVLPTISKASVREKLLEYGAKIIVFGASINEADKHLKNLMMSIDTTKTTPIYCHPFQHPLVWEGHSSLVDEIVQNQLSKSQASHLKGIVCSCGGGGLYNGMYQGLRNNKIASDILLIETIQAPTLSESVKAGELITLESVNSMATSLACSYTTQQTMINFHNQSDSINTRLELIDDMDTLRACVEYYNKFGNVVEPACGAALSAVFNKIDLLYKTFAHLNKDDIVVIVVCGGSCTTTKDLSRFQLMISRNEIKL
jgi:L-serine/L-threonine ammonia-lyase